MLQALAIGLIGSSALVLGGLAGAVWNAPSHVTGVLLAFASGALIAALAFELFPEAVDVGGLGPSVAGLLTGAVVFVTVNTLVDSRVAAGAGDPDSVPAPAPVSEAVAGAEADQRDKLSTAAAKHSQAPTGVAMRSGRRSRRFVIGIWTIAAVLLSVAVVVGRVVADAMSPGTLAFALSFAGGAVLASLADTLMPEAFERGRPFNAMATAVGFLLAFVLSDL